MGIRVEGTAADNAAHAVEQELHDASNNPQALHDKLLQSFLGVSATSADTQGTFLRYLNSDDPTALEKVQKLVPELHIATDEDRPIHVDKPLSSADAAALTATAAIAEEGHFGTTAERNSVRRESAEVTSSDMSARINRALQAIGMSHDAVSVESSANPNDPDEMVLRQDGTKMDAVVLRAKTAQ